MLLRKWGEYVTTNQISKSNSNLKTTLKITVKIIFSALLALQLIQSGCKEKEITEPIIPIPEEIKPGRRDYEWKEYILEPSFNYYVRLRSMWGASPNDIWACGQAYLSKSQVWHFDGTTWTESGDLVPDRDQTSVWGSSANDIWMSNEVGKMFHYDGKEWTEKTRLKVDWFDYVLVNSIWGLSSNEVYASGFCFQPFPTSKEQNNYGVVFKYDGKEWKQLKLPIRYTNFGFVRKDRDGILYLAAFNSDSGLGEIYSYDGVYLNNLFTFNDTPYLINIAGYVYTQKQNKIYRLNKSGFTEAIELNNLELPGAILGGRSIKDFFAISKNGIEHYNGSDFLQIYPLAFRASVPAALLFDKDVFFPIVDFNINKTRILHGKLNK